MGGTLARILQRSPLQQILLSKASCSIHSYLLSTSNISGIAASIRETWEFGSLSNSVPALENNFASEAICA